MKLIPLPYGKFVMCDDWAYELLLGMGPWYWEDNVTYVRVFRTIVEPDGHVIQATMPSCLKGPAPKGYVWDHIDRNGFNNQDNNLRLATHSQNAANRGTFRNNTTGYRGVHYHKVKKKYGAKIGFNGKHLHLGYFTSIHDAALAYNDAAKRLFGEFAYQNTIIGETGESLPPKSSSDAPQCDSNGDSQPPSAVELKKMESMFSDLL